MRVLHRTVDYVLLGDELDSPRGRIYLIQEMLEKDKPPTADVVKHIDRACRAWPAMTTCHRAVNYMHLVDQGVRMSGILRGR